MNNRLIIIIFFLTLNCSTKKESQKNIIDSSGIKNESLEEKFSDSTKYEIQKNVGDSAEIIKENIREIGPIIYQKEIYHSFSSVANKDLFKIYVTGKSLVKGQVHFQIIDNQGKVILNESFVAYGDLGYHMHEEKLDGHKELTLREQEDYIKGQMDDFLSEKAFESPVKEPSNISFFESPKKEIWKDIVSDKSSISFGYAVGYQDGREIAYSKKLKKVYVLVFCC